MNVQVQRHAAMRFEERVRPGMTLRDAGLELARLLREFGRRVEPPAWLEGYPLEEDCCFVEVCDGVVCIVKDASDAVWPIVLTVLTRGGIGDGLRDRRRGDRRSYRGAKGRKVSRAQWERARERETRSSASRRPRARDWAPDN